MSQGAETSLRPVLFLYDGELLAPTQRPDLGPWQTQLTVLRQLTAYGFPAIGLTVAATKNLLSAGAEDPMEDLRRVIRAAVS